MGTTGRQEGGNARYYDGARMKMPSMKDSRGGESTTLAFVAASWLSTTVVFIWKGTGSDMISYGAAVAAIMAIWLGREWAEKRKPNA